MSFSYRKTTKKICSKAPSHDGISKKTFFPLRYFEMYAYISSNPKSKVISNMY